MMRLLLITKLKITFWKNLLSLFRLFARCVFKINIKNETVKIKRLYQCGISEYQLKKLKTLEFYDKFLDKYIDRRDFELI